MLIAWYIIQTALVSHLFYFVIERVESSRSVKIKWWFNISNWNVFISCFSWLGSSDLAAAASLVMESGTISGCRPFTSALVVATRDRLLIVVVTFFNRNLRATRTISAALSCYFIITSLSLSISYYTVRRSSLFVLIISHHTVSTHLIIKLLRHRSSGQLLSTCTCSTQPLCTDV